MLATAGSLSVGHLPIEFQVLGLTWCTDVVSGAVPFPRRCSELRTFVAL